MSTGQFRESANKMTCSLRVQYTGALNGYNYVYISDFSRYYFITEHTIERTGVHRFELKTDVLFSNLTDIKLAAGIIERNESETQTKLFDDRLKFLGYKLVNTRNLGTIEDGECFVLVVNGGGVSV